MNDDRWYLSNQGRESPPSPTDAQAAIALVILLGVVFIGMLPAWLPKAAAFLAGVQWVWPFV